MTKIISVDDKKYLKLCIDAARQTYEKHGNYPVGAALVIDNKLVAVSGNEIKQKRSFVHHAENQLIINNATRLFEAFESNEKIILYSTLEPCIQCLGASVTNHINKIIYIQEDPNGGACGLRHDNIGLFYKQHWPEIIHASVSSEPLELMLKFFRSEMEKGNTKWPSRMLSLLEKQSLD